MRTLQPAGGDATGAIQAALDQGPGVLCLGPGEYRCDGLRIPEGVVLAGEGPA